MSMYMRSLRRNWLSMLELPWRPAPSKQGREKVWHWLVWSAAWAWTVAGLVLGALVAPPLVQRFGIPYEDSAVIGVAVVAGFFVQLIGWTVFDLLTQAGYYVMGRLLTVPDGLLRRRYKALVVALKWGFWPILVVSSLVPLAGVGFGLYRYFTWVGPAQGQVTIAFLGSLLVKTALLPLIKYVVTGWGLQRFLKWLRGDKVSTSKP